MDRRTEPCLSIPQHCLRPPGRVTVRTGCQSWRELALRAPPALKSVQPLPSLAHSHLSRGQVTGLSLFYRGRNQNTRTVTCPSHEASEEHEWTDSPMSSDP